MKIWAKKMETWIIVVCVVVALWWWIYRHRSPHSLPLIVHRPGNNVSEAFVHSGLVRETKDASQCDLLFLESLTDVEALMRTVQVPRRVRFLGGLAGVDALADKASLCRIMRPSEYLPRTFILPQEEDAMRAAMGASPDAAFILKTNEQRQQGHQLVRGKDAIQLNKRFVVGQEMLRDPLLVGGRKVNLRIYVLMTNRAYQMFDDGFVYYTPKPYVPDSVDAAEVITTGYIDRRVYDENPLTVQQLLRHLGPAAGATLRRNIERMVSAVGAAYLPHIKRANAGAKQVRFMILGFDVAPDARLGVKLMEINKGPDLTFKDERDRAVKVRLASTVLRLLVEGAV